MKNALWLAGFAASLTKPGLACIDLGGFAFSVEDEVHSGRRTLEEMDMTETKRKGALEKVLLETPNEQEARHNLRYYASVPHMAGTQGDYEMAVFTQKMMKSFGLEDSIIHEMDAFLNYPVSRSLEMENEDGKVIYQAPLIESELEMDPTSKTEWRNMSFLAYGPSGEVKAPLVYANYGRPQDFDFLKRNGVDVKGKIAIVRYGECFRGLKVMNAQAHGAAGVLIYSDPADDGYRVGEVYPNGPWRPEDSLQRGSAQFNSLCGGDPGRPNAEEKCGYRKEDMIPSIPILPLSYGDAIPLLKALHGREAPMDWVGGLSDKITYRFGPSAAKIHLTVNNTFTTTTIWNVITTVKGELDTPVVLSNHRDAWVFGAADPNSGSTVMLETARSIGALVKSGWKPKRTLIFGSWSGEEYGLLGSTGWAEQFADTVLKDAVALINTDVGVSGTAFRSGGSPSLARTIQRAAKKVTDPLTGKSLFEVWDKKVTTLGSGSDYTVFLHHLGIPSLDFSFGPSNGKAYGVYHSIYDSYTWIETQVDPHYQLHTALAKVLALVTLDIADSEILPIDPADLGHAMKHYIEELNKITSLLDLKPMMNAVDYFQDKALQFGDHIIRKLPSKCVNTILGKLERSFLDPEGLYRRKWFKHVLQSPGFYLGYAAQVYPGIQDALTDGKVEIAQSLVHRVAELIEKAANRLKDVSFSLRDSETCDAMISID